MIAVAASGPVRERASISVPRAGVRLEGELLRPADARAGVVVAHPHPFMGGDSGSPVVRALVDACAKRGLLSLRFDFRHARGRADAPVARLVADSAEDLEAAVANTRARLGPDARVALAGYSFGGLVAARVASSGGASALAVVGLPTRLAGEAAEVAWSALAKVAPPFLVLQGEFDDVGSPESARAFLSERGVGADVRVVPNASHGYFGAEARVASIAAGFLAKRLA